MTFKRLIVARQVIQLLEQRRAASDGISNIAGLPA
jgi:hypothetical protein